MPNGLRCPNCGNEISSGSRYCLSCGTRLCPNCHSMVHIDDRHCSVCNNLLGPSGITPGTGTTQPNPPSPPPQSTPRWSQPSPSQAYAPPPSTSPWPQPSSQHAPTPQSWPADTHGKEHTTPGGFITGRHPTRESSPIPPAPGYPQGQPGEQERIPIPTPVVSSQSNDSSGYGAAGEGAPAYAQAGVGQQASQWESQTWKQAGIKNIPRQSSPL